MTDDKRRPDSRKSRQDLLDEIYLLRDTVGEREQRVRQLEDDLNRVLRSRSWWLTTPLRMLSRELKRRVPINARPVQGIERSLRMGSNSVRSNAGKTQTSRSDYGLVARQPGQPCLFVDVTELALREGRTGIQRVTREILRALLLAPPEGYAVQPVYAAAGQPYRLAHRFLAKELGGPDTTVPEPPMQAQPGDVFLGLDHSMWAVIEHADELAALREGGVRTWFVCNDTLPLSRPEWFTPDVHETFKTWFGTIARAGDGIACISRTTETDVRHWLGALSVERDTPLALGHFHLGSETRPDDAASGMTQDPHASIERLRDKPSFLTVGTIEPRKGHAQTLEAFNQLWAHGNDVALVIVGLPGWMTEVVQRRIRHHDELGKRLLWFADASDALLEQLYEHCTALLAPSKGEGFGLPLIEAARHGLPILCRDLPVFHEVAGECARYFSGNDATSLAQAVESWLDAQRQGRVPSTAAMPRLTWAESAQQLLDVMLDGRADAILTNNRRGSEQA